MSSVTISSSFNIMDNSNFSRLENYINKVLQDDLSLQDEKARVICRSILQVVAMAIVTSARVGMTMICISGSADILDLRIKDPRVLAMGITNAAGAIVAFGFLSAYSKLKIIDAITRRVSSEEQSLISDRESCYTRTAIKIIAVTGGFLAQVPMGYAAYESALFAPTTIGVLTFLDGGRSSYSTYMTLKGISDSCKRSKLDIEKELIQVRTTLVKRIAHFRQFLACKGEIQPLLEMDVNHDDFNENDIDSNFFLNRVIKGNFDISASSSAPLDCKAKVGIETLVLLMTGAILAEFFRLGEEGAKVFSDDDTFIKISGIFVTIANAHLWYSMIRKASYFSINFFRGANRFSLTKKLMPRFYKWFTGVGSFFAVPTFVPSVLFAKLYFPEALYYPVATFASLATFFGGLSALHGLRDIIIQTCQKDDNLLKLDTKLQKISATISKTDLPEIASFLSHLEDDLRNSIHSPSLKELNNYIQLKNN